MYCVQHGVTLATLLVYHNHINVHYVNQQFGTISVLLGCLKLLQLITSYTQDRVGVCFMYNHWVGYENSIDMEPILFHMARIGHIFHFSIIMRECVIHTY